MNVRVAFGRGSVAVPLPSGVTAEWIEQVEAAPVDDAARSVAAALEAPIGSPPLADLARGKRTAVISVPDGTRPTPLHVILPPLLDAIAAKIPRENVLVLFATGMHRAVTEAEANRLLGQELAAGIRWESHDVARTRRIGVTGRGAVMDVDERFLDADLRISIGLVEPHLLAGFSGGRKLVAPGLVSFETMRVLHGPEIVGHAKARAGVLDGNPMHEEALAIARAADLHFAVNVTIGKERRLAGVFAGDLDRSHRAACEWLAKLGLVDRGDRDLVITCGGGAPLDATFYQSVKGIVSAEPIVRKGGAVLLCAEGSEGWGSADFVSLLGVVPDLASFYAWARTPGNFRKDQWMVQHFRETTEHVRVFLYSKGLDYETARGFGVTPVASPEEGVRLALEGATNPDVAYIPNGPYSWVRKES